MKSSDMSDGDRAWAWVDGGMLFLVALVVRAIVCQRIHHISSDEFFYTVVARDIYRIWTHQLQATVHGMDTLHPGGASMVLAAVFLATGKPLIAVGQHLNTVMSALTVMLTYWMAREAVGSRWIAFTAAFLMAFMPVSIRDADRVYADNQATLLVTLAMACAFRSWRTGSRLAWLWACTALGAAFLTKEYLIVLTAPALVIGSLLSIRRHRWTYAPSLILILAAVSIGVWFIQFKSMALPQASYLLTEIHGERQDYVGRMLPSMKKLMSQHLAEPDVPFVFLGFAVLGYAILLRSLRKPASVMPDGATQSITGAVLALIVLPVTFCLFFSSFRNLWGTRLVFPSFPAICTGSAAGLLASGSVPGMIGLVIVAVLTFSLLDVHTGLWANYLVAVYSIPVAAMALHGLRMVLLRRNAPVGHRSLLAYAVFGVVLLTVAAPCIARVRLDLVEQAARNRRFGPQYGMFRAAGWIEKNIDPDEYVLACNPRQMAYFAQSTYAHLLYAPWWRSHIELTEEWALDKYRVKWILISQPEISPVWGNQLYHHLKNRPDMREAYTLSDEHGMALAFFEVVDKPRR